MPDHFTVGELRRLIADLDDATPVLTSGYESGLTRVAGAATAEVQELDRGSDLDFVGPFAYVDEAQRQASGEADGDWKYMIGGQPPKLVGDPFTALMIWRGAP